MLTTSLILHCPSMVEFYWKAFCNLVWAIKYGTGGANKSEKEEDNLHYRP